MLARLTPEKEAALEASIPRRPSDKDFVPRWNGSSVDNLPGPSSTAPPSVQAVPDPVKAAIDQVRFEALRQALQPGHFQFGAATYSANESSQIATIPVIRTGGSQGVVTVTFATRDGTATAGTDYTATTQTLTFADGETTKTVTIPILNDQLVGGNKTVLLTLSDPTLVEGDQAMRLVLNAVTGGATLGDPQTAVLTIVDDIGPTVVGLNRSGIHHQPTHLVLTFSEPLDPSRAQYLSDYTLVAPGHDGRFGTRDDQVICINSATYNPATRTVTLTRAAISTGTAAIGSRSKARGRRGSPMWLEISSMATGMASLAVITWPSSGGMAWPASAVLIPRGPCRLDTPETGRTVSEQFEGICSHTAGRR